LVRPVLDLNAKFVSGAKRPHWVAKFGTANHDHFDGSALQNFLCLRAGSDLSDHSHG
jgi:hypothetical protein